MSSQALTGPVHLVGGKLSCADVELLECTLMLEEKFPAILADFPSLKVNVTRCVRLDMQQERQQQQKRELVPMKTHTSNTKCSL